MRHVTLHSETCDPHGETPYTAQWDTLPCTVRRHLTLHGETPYPHSEASAQFETEPSLSISPTSPWSPVPAFLASSLLWQRVYPKLQGEKRVSRKMSKFIYCGQKMLKMHTMGRTTWKPSASVILSVYAPCWCSLCEPVCCSPELIISQHSLKCGLMLWLCAASLMVWKGRKAKRQFQTGMMGTLMLDDTDFIHHILIVWQGVDGWGHGLLFKIQSAK